MKAKPVIILLAFIVLLIGFLLVINKNKSSFSKKDTNFSLEKGLSINKLIIESQGNTLTLEKVNNFWLVDNKLMANTKMLAATIKVLEQVQMQYPVSKNQQKAIIDSISVKGTKVLLFNGNTCIYSLNFYDIDRITYALNRKNVPFALKIAGYEKLCMGDILATNKSKWIKNLLIDLNEIEIEKISLNYETKQTESFILNVDSSTIILSDFESNTIKNANSENLSDYLHFFKGITFEQTNENVISRMSNQIDFTLIIKTKAGKEIMLEGHSILLENNSGKDINIFAGIVNKSDTILLNYSAFDPILVDKSFFLKK